jgi:hypothetical protein
MNTLRHLGNARRLALLGAVCSVVIALSGLVSAPAARAASPPFLGAMARALARVHAYQLTAHTTSAGYGGGPITATSAGTVVGGGKTLRLHLTTTMQRAGQVSTLEEVFTGTHLCVRMSAGSAWSCSASASSALARLQSTDPTKLAQAFGLSQTYVPMGQHTRQGQVCTGYRFSFTVSGLHGQGTLWIARATSLPVEEDTVSTLALRTGAPPLVVRSTQLWSRWNDPRLTIPSVPAS